MIGNDEDNYHLKESTSSSAESETDTRALSNVNNIFSFSSSSSNSTIAPTISQRHNTPTPPRTAGNPAPSPTSISTRTSRPSRPKSLLEPSFSPTTRTEPVKSKAPTRTPILSTRTPQWIPTRKPSSVSTILRDPWKSAPSKGPSIKSVTSKPITTSPTVAPQSSSSSSTLKPSIQSSNITPNNPCPLSSDGSFGIPLSSQSTPQTVLSFNYQVETQLASPTLKDLERLVSKVEVAVSNILVQTFFTACQKSPTTRTRRDMKQVQSKRLYNTHYHHRALSIEGISSLPLDIIQGGATCPLSPLNTNNTCIVIRGGLTLYGNATSYIDQQTAMNVIKSGMLHGSFKNADSSIVRVTYLSDGTTTIQSEPISIHPSSSSLNTLSITAIASSLIVFIFALIAARRYVSQKHKALLLKHEDEGHNNSMHFVEIEIRHDQMDKQSLLEDEKDDFQDDSLDNSFSTSEGGDFYEDASEVIVLNELGEELWLSLGENKPPSENASSSHMTTDHSTIKTADHSSVQSHTFNAWLYSDDGTFV